MKHAVHLTALFVAIVLGGVSPAEARSGGKHMTFDMLDTNGDGKITQEEMKNRAAARFAAIDADGDKTVSLEELRASLREGADARADKMMEHLDADKNGAISEEEMAAARQERGGKRAKRAERMFERADANNDGALDREEFEAARAKFAKHRKGKKPSE